MKNMNENMAIEEIENTEEVVDSGKSNTKILAGVGLAGLALGIIAHKYGKKIAAKIKGKLKKNDNDEDLVETDFDDSVDN